MKKPIAVCVRIDHPAERPTDPVELFEWLQAHPDLAEELLRSYRKARRNALHEANQDGKKKNPRTKTAARNRKVSEFLGNRHP
jgi:GrpB-like predicted nucleotidyltransferase (UPF0157 family)